MSWPTMCTGKSPVCFRLELGRFGQRTVKLQSYKTISELLMMANIICKTQKFLVHLVFSV